MNLHDEVAEGGSVLIIGTDGDYSEGDLRLTIVLMNRGDGVCEARGAIGNLDYDTNIQLGVIAIKHGYHTMKIKVLEGQQVSRWAEFVANDRVFDYYTVDLVATAARLGV